MAVEAIDIFTQGSPGDYYQVMNFHLCTNDYVDPEVSEIANIDQIISHILNNGSHFLPLHTLGFRFDFERRSKLLHHEEISEPLILHPVTSYRATSLLKRSLRYTPVRCHLKSIMSRWSYRTPHNPTRVDTLVYV